MRRILNSSTGLQRLCWCVALVITLPADAQQFTNVTALMPFNDQLSSSAFYGAGITVIDLDNDGWDDVVVPRMNQSAVWYHNVGGVFVRQELIPSSADVKSIIFSDADRDGDYDAAVISRNSSYKFFENEGGVFEWNQSCGIQSPDNSGGYGCTWGDVNNDGYSDLYVCSYNTLSNSLFINQGNGTFLDLASVYDVDNGVPVTNFSFQASILDLDFDGDQDIHVINDRFPIDALFLKTGAQHFSDIAASCGLNEDVDSMSSSICDYDHDGDYDIYVTSTALQGNFLFEDQGGLMFEDVGGELGLSVHLLCWGALWIDVDNDSWDDLYICSAAGSNVANPVYRNNSGDFSLMTDFANQHPGYSSYAVAKGDFNKDGYYDIVVATESMPVQFYYNNGGANRWLNITLEGVNSNPDGLGAWIEYWLGESRMIRQFRSGENYLSQNSQHEIIGLKGHTTLDSLKVHWPSGQVDGYYHIPTNQYLHLVEGELWSGEIETSTPFICEGQSAELSVNNAVQVFWNNGATEQFIAVSEPGEYQAWWVGADGLLHQTPSVELHESGLDPVQMNEVHPSCFNSEDGAIELISSNTWSVATWSNGAEGTALTGLSPGMYSFQGIADSGCPFALTVALSAPDSLVAVWASSSVDCHGESSGEIQIIEIIGGSGETGFWLTDEWGDMVNPDQLPFGEYWLTIFDEQGCSAVDTILVSQPAPLSMEVSVSEDQALVQVAGGVPPYGYIWNGQEVDDPPFMLVEGLNSLQVFDAAGCAVEEWLDYTAQQVREGESQSQRLNVINGAWIWTGQYPLASLKLWDCQGRLILSVTDTRQIPMLESGVYVGLGIDQMGGRFPVRVLIP